MKRGSAAVGSASGDSFFFLFPPKPRPHRQRGRVTMLPSHMRPHLFSRKILFKSLPSYSSLAQPPPASLSSSAPASARTETSIPTTSSAHHHSLATFLAHAARSSLSPTSTVYVGTYYEYLCQATLPRLGFHGLTRMGGRADRGIDLLARWTLPSLPYALRAIVQCKATKAAPAPERIRELEGVLAGAPDGWRAANNTVAVLCATQAATRGVRDAVRRCRIPAVWVMLDEQPGSPGTGRVRQVLWNEKVAAMGAQGVGVGVRYVVGAHENNSARLEKEAVLLWEGREWNPLKEEAASGESAESAGCGEGGGGRSGEGGSGRSGGGRDGGSGESREDAGCGGGERERAKPPGTI